LIRAILSPAHYLRRGDDISYYGVPYTVGASMNHIWRPLVEKAGYQMEDIPKTWDVFYDFFKDAQKKLGAQGMRHVYGLGFQLNTAGNDSSARVA
jgi:multiple sugar transport system substrate-binding protein